MAFETTNPLEFVCICVFKNAHLRFLYVLGIVEVKLERPGAKNAIGRDMLRGLQQTFDAIEKDHSANVVMICSSVPKVFCAGADLKVILMKLSAWVSWK